MAEYKDLTPWLEYFGMLRKYEDSGQLWTVADKHEAYVTQPALLTLSAGGSEVDTSPENEEATKRLLALGSLDIVRRLRAYAGWKSQQGPNYLIQNFAVHVVRDTEPHEPICTLLLSRRRWPFHKQDHITTIPYDDHG